MRQALGKGLNALIKQTTVTEKDKKTVTKIPINKIRPNRYQPRKVFKDKSLQELAQSIKDHGLTQPIIVTYDEKTGKYELIAGERRFRACQLAGLTEMDAIVRGQTDNEQMLAVSLVENIQREDLNPIDTALAFRQLINHFGIAQTELAKYCSKSESAVSNTLRLLELDDYIQKALQTHIISEGHARTLISVDGKNQRKILFDRIISEKLTVRQLEALASQQRNGPKKRRKCAKSADILHFEDMLKTALGTKVELCPSNRQGFGKLVINYHSYDELDNISKKLIK